MKKLNSIIELDKFFYEQSVLDNTSIKKYIIGSMIKNISKLMVDEELINITEEEDNLNHYYDYSYNTPNRRIRIETYAMHPEEFEKLYVSLVSLKRILPEPYKYLIDDILKFLKT